MSAVPEGVTLRQLRYLVAVLDHGSFTAAAAALHVAQPSLSQQVRQLEATIGGDLLVRAPGGVRTTPAGDVLVPKARVVLATVADGVRLAEREVDEPGGVCLAVVAGTPTDVLAVAVSRWRAERPDAPVRWHEHGDQRRVEEKLDSSPGVIGVGEAPTRWAGRVVDLGTDPFVLVRPAVVAAGRALPLVRSGYEPRVPGAERFGDGTTVDAPGPGAALGVVRAGAAVAVLPASAVGDPQGVRTEPLDVPPRRFAALLHPGPTAASAAMADLLADAARAATGRAARRAA